jgi:hypothetical protein
MTMYFWCFCELPSEQATSCAATLSNASFDGHSTGVKVANTVFGTWNPAMVGRGEVAGYDIDFREAKNESTVLSLKV